MRRFIRQSIAFGLLLTLSPMSGLAETDRSTEDSVRTHILELIKQGRELQSQNTIQLIDSAFSVFMRAAESSIKHFGNYDSLYAWSLYRLAINRYAANDPLAALDYLERMRAVVDSAYNKSYKLRYYCLGTLGNILMEVSDYSRALQVYEEQVAMLEGMGTELDDNQVTWLSRGYNDLGRVCEVIGENPDTVVFLFNKALDLIEHRFGRDHPRYGAILGNIGWHYKNSRQYDLAEAALWRALSHMKENHAPEAVNSVVNAVFLADCLRMRGDFRTSDSILQRQLKIIDSTTGDRHPRKSYVIGSLARLYAAKDSLETATGLAQAALDLNRGSSEFPTHAFQIYQTLVGEIALAAHNDNLAVKAIDGFSSARQSFLMNVFRYASELQKLQFVRLFPPIESHLLAGVFQSRDPAIIHAGINTVLRGKGLAVDAIASEQAIATCSNDPILENLLDEHRRISEWIASLIISSISLRKDDLIDSLFTAKERLETELSMICSNVSFFVSLDSVTGSHAADSLPPGSVLLDYIKFEDYDYDKICMNQDYDTVYGLITIDGSGQQLIMSLGRAVVIDSLIQMYRSCLDVNQTDELREVGNRLYHKIVGPVGDVLADVKRVYVSADGALNLIPFETLIDDSGQFLIENYEFVYLSSGRDLLEPKSEISSGRAVVVADPDFMSESKPTRSFAMVSDPSGLSFRGSTECLASMFPPLPMSLTEGIAVTNSLKDAGSRNVAFFTGPDASESVLKSMNQAPSILHIATHGYFCQQAPSNAFENPLLRSGLILAGANRTISEASAEESYGDDGVLTALEVSGLNLIGTDLVVLSACQTGVGDIMSGEGVFGLRRAFQHAGAKSIVMSLFEVPDETTMTLMASFYENWLSGESKSSALRNSSLNLLRERRAKGLSTHPVYWGGFILVGSPG